MPHIKQNKLAYQTYGIYHEIFLICFKVFLRSKQNKLGFIKYMFNYESLTANKFKYS